MAVTLRLTRGGVPGRPHYRIVAAEKERPRDGKFIEVIGYYTPVNPPVVHLEEDRINFWLKNGALPTRVVRSLLVKKFPGLIEGRENHKLEKIRAARKARKARAKGGAKSAKKTKSKSKAS